MSRRALLNSHNSQPPQDNNFYGMLPIRSVHLFLLFVMALALTLFLASGTVTAEKLFQSPQSPPLQPPPEQPVPEQPQPEQPVPEQPQPEQPQPEQPAPEQSQPTAEQPSSDQGTVEQAPAQPIDEAAPAPTLEPLDPLTLEEAGDEFELSAPGDQDSPMVLDEAELIDSIVVSGAYLWLCCGVILLLLIPLFMLILYIRGRSKIVNEDGF